MDPTQTLADMLVALDDARDNLRDLLGWLIREGSAPNVPEAIRLSGVLRKEND